MTTHLGLRAVVTRVCVWLCASACLTAVCALGASQPPPAGADNQIPSRTRARGEQPIPVRNTASSRALSPTDTHATAVAAAGAAQGYWCGPRTEATRAGHDLTDHHDPHERGGWDDWADLDGPDQLDDLIDTPDAGEPSHGVDRRTDGGNRIWLDPGQDQDWPIDLTGLGIQVRIGAPTSDTTSDTAGAGERGRRTSLEPHRERRSRCQLTPTSASRTDQNNNRWGCVLTNPDTTAPGSGPRAERSNDRRDGRVIIGERPSRDGWPTTRDWPDDDERWPGEQRWPDQDAWWPITGPDTATGTTAHAAPTAPALSPTTHTPAASTPAADAKRCLLLWPGGPDGMEIHLGALSKVGPPAT